MTIHIETPLLESRSMGERMGVPVFLKMEALQPVGSFKARGIGEACRQRAGGGAARFVCASGGNAGYAAAYSGRRLGLPTTIVVPSSTPEEMQSRIRAEKAQVIVHGDSWDDAFAYAEELAKRPRTGHIHPFDDPQVWAGHATMVDELAAVLGEPPGAVVAAVGGGGLLCGLLEGMHRVGWTRVPVLAVETEGAASFAASIAAGRIVQLEEISSIATTLGARAVAEAALEWTHRHPVTSWTTSDRAALNACLDFADDHRVLVEPACGAALAAVYTRAKPLIGLGSILIIVCGGAGVSRSLLDGWDKSVQT